jgi:glycosyltransferase involved in cell wall biosynthesis
MNKKTNKIKLSNDNLILSNIKHKKIKIKNNNVFLNKKDNVIQHINPNNNLLNYTFDNSSNIIEQKIQYSLYKPNFNLNNKNKDKNIEQTSINQTSTNQTNIIKQTSINQTFINQTSTNQTNIIKQTSTNQTNIIKQTTIKKIIILNEISKFTCSNSDIEIIKHTKFLEAELQCKSHTIINGDYSIIQDYDIVFLQNILLDFTTDTIEKPKYKLIYIVHNIADELTEEQIAIYMKNKNNIDIYIFINKYLKDKFEKLFFIPKISYIIEKQPLYKQESTYVKQDLFIVNGQYTVTSQYYELIKIFKLLDKKYQLEIHGDIQDKEYYTSCKLYIEQNNLPIKLFTSQDDFLEHLQYAEYYLVLQEYNKVYIYDILQAILLNKKILCNADLIKYNVNIKWYPNKILNNMTEININILNECISLQKIHYIPNFSNILYKNLLIHKQDSKQKSKQKIGNITVHNIEQVLADIKKYYFKTEKNGYSFLLRIKNEQYTIRKCIIDIVDLADEIIVVDNNSTDDTLKIIKELEQIYSNVFVYEYNINIPRYGNEHIDNFKLDTISQYNTLSNYYNWTASKARFNKKIKWDGDFYCIKVACKELLEKFRHETNTFACHFSGLTIYTKNDNIYIKNKSFYNEYRLFLNSNKYIWTDNIIDNKNYCETSENFVKSITEKYIYMKPIFLEIKDCDRNEFSSRSFELQDGRDNIDMINMNNINKLKVNNNYYKTTNLFYDLEQYNFFLKEPYEKYFYYESNCININKYNELYPCTNLSQWCAITQYCFKKKYKILLVIDRYDWAFGHISNEIKRYNIDYDITIILYTLPYNKLPLEFYDNVVFFWYGGRNNDILDFYKNRGSNIFICIYDYSLWINNHNKDDENRNYKKLEYFLNNSDGYLYSSPFILQNLLIKYPTISKMPKYKCYDGVNIDLFCFQQYPTNIYIKPQLIIGWIGNSNPSGHGINKGFTQIQNVVQSMDDKFKFLPRDSFTHGILPHERIPEYLNKIDIIVCFSVAEGTPNQILEASSSGKCWISTKVGIVEDLYDAETPPGIIINRQETELKEALLMLYNNRKLIVKYGKNGRNLIEKQWSWKEKINQFYYVFDKEIIK